MGAKEWDVGVGSPTGLVPMYVNLWFFLVNYCRGSLGFHSLCGVGVGIRVGARVGAKEWGLRA